MLKTVYAYWVYRRYKGAKPAFNLVIALGTESLERRFDAAFGVIRTESERNDPLSQRIQELESDFQKAFWVDDEARIERDHFERLLKEHGINPWEILGAND